ncbi:unnamed protein product [Schistocephalus solidus]|uniref:Uncharacterized protein n=1 Tax=Schistocephalus solidus TaxID=70667 RepID=A0A183SA33_SCHSO|nr:unnamed protein product [Schistocephalus solidus]
MQVLHLLLLPTVVATVCCLTVDRCSYLPVCQLCNLDVKEGQLVFDFFIHDKLDVGKDGIQQCPDSLQVTPPDYDERVVGYLAQNFGGYELKTSDLCRNASAISPDRGEPLAFPSFARRPGR